MRPGLVAVGVVLVALGAISAVLVLPDFVGAANTPHAATGQAPVNLPSGASQLLPINGTDTTSGSFTLSWSAAAPLNVTLYERGSCSPGDYPCILGNTADHWADVESGSFSAQGAVAYPYLIELDNLNPTPTTSLIQWTQHTEDSPFSLLTAVVLLLSVLLLAIIGGLVLFLGLFLRGGVYSGRRDLVSQSAEDVDELDSEWEDHSEDDRIDEE